jgi:PD-(D/E)XK nuclease superfamily protein
MNPREQGDLGERAAAVWLLSQGYPTAYPFGHRADWDLLTEIDHTIYKVQVKTTTVYRRGRWELTLCTRGGNQSWSGLVKLLDASRCHFVFALVGDGRQWFIPVEALGGGTRIRLGGPKYAEFEVDRGPPIRAETPHESISRIAS